MRFLIGDAAGLQAGSTSAPQWNDAEARAAGFDGVDVPSVSEYLDGNWQALFQAGSAARNGKANAVQTWNLAPGRGSLGAAVERFVKFAGAAADLAQEEGVSLLVENRGRLRLGHELWVAMESLNHRAIACAWDYVSAMELGESPFVSVPTLNSRIRSVIIHASRVDSDRQVIASLLHRLRGIGFAGDVVARFDGVVTPDRAAEVLKQIKSIGGLEPKTAKPAEKKKAVDKT